MVCPTFISLDQFTHYQPSQVGGEVILLGTLFTEGIPVPPMICVPHETLLRLTRENNLVETLEKISSSRQTDIQTNYTLKTQLCKAITSQLLPNWFTDELLTEYHHIFQRGFVKLLPGEIVPGFDESKFEHIQGDSNLIESFLNFWASLVEIRLSRSTLPVAEILTPTSIIIQAQYQPLVSGVAHTQSPDDGLKTHITLQAIWGAPHGELLESQADIFSVDVRTWHIIRRDVVQKKVQYQRTTDALNRLPVPQQYQLHPTLTDEQASAIGQVAFAIKQKRMAHQLIKWELTREGLFITDVHEIQDRLHTKTAAIKKTLTKIYISAGNPYKQATQITPNIDGVGVLRSEYTLAKFGVHPQHVLQTRQKQVLQKELVKTIRAYQTALPYKPILYRSQNFTSVELRQLQHAENYEPQEINPYLGYRGGLQMVRQPELFQFELEVIRDALQTSQAPLGLLLSFVRSPSELDHLLHEIDVAGLNSFPQFGTWLQLNTPENCINLRAYPTHKLAGVSLNVKSVQALLLGVDPENSEIYQHYVLETQGLLLLMEQLAHTVKELQELREHGEKLQLHLHLEEYSHELVAEAVKLGYHGIVAKPAAIQITRACVVETEQARLAQLG